MTKQSPNVWNLELGYWNLSGDWCLVIGDCLVVGD
jgi:hypothetical protein